MIKICPFGKKSVPFGKSCLTFGGENSMLWRTLVHIPDYPNMLASQHRRSFLPCWEEKLQGFFMKKFMVIRGVLLALLSVIISQYSLFAFTFVLDECSETSIIGIPCKVQCSAGTFASCHPGWFFPSCTCVPGQSRQTNALRPLPVLTPEMLLQSRSLIQSLLATNDPLLMEIAYLAQRITDAILSGNALDYTIAETLLAEKIRLLSTVQSQNFQQMAKSIIAPYQGKYDRNLVTAGSIKKLSVYPNPAGQYADIIVPHSAVSSGAMVSVAIYNQFGQIVKQYTAVSQPAIQWDATNHQGNTVPNGVYMVKLIVGTEVFTQQLILAR
jgi:hypothetical protein